MPPCKSTIVFVIDNPNPVTQRMLPRFGAAYTKLRAFELEGLDKVVFLDADTVVLQNVDDLFDRPAIAAAPDFFMPDRFRAFGIRTIARLMISAAPPCNGALIAWRSA